MMRVERCEPLLKFLARQGHTHVGISLTTALACPGQKFYARCLFLLWADFRSLNSFHFPKKVSKIQLEFLAKKGSLEAFFCCVLSTFANS